MKCQVATGVVVLLIAAQSIDAHFDPNFKPRKQSTLGGTCSSNSACDSIQHSWCHVASPTCGMGSCQCLPGYMQVFNQSGCHAIKRIGDACSSTDYCADSNSECYEGKCTCNAGFSSIGGICAAGNMRKHAGERCNDPVECLGHLTCVDNVCGCYPQYKVSGCCDCVKKTVGDSCVANKDCIYSPNAICLDGRCTCETDSREVEYQSITEPSYSKYRLQPSECVKKRVCVKNSRRLRYEGETCAEPNPDDPLQVFSLCKAPFVCTPCSSFTSLCSFRPDACFTYKDIQASDDAVSATLCTLLFIFGTMISLYNNH